MDNNHIAVAALVLAVLIGGYFYIRFQESNERILQLQRSVEAVQAQNLEISERLDKLKTSLELTAKSVASVSGVCTTSFAPGVYQLETSTPYGAALEDGETYSISQISVEVGSWSVNAGMALNSFNIPTALYVDYDADGIVDSGIAARLAREVPFVGNTLADRLLAGTSTSQALYRVFSCEWSGADYTSTDNVSEEISGSTEMLWELIQEYSSSIQVWIDEVATEQIEPI